MSYPREATGIGSQTEITARAGHVTACVNGHLRLVKVVVEGEFHSETACCLRKAINRALIAAREEVARELIAESSVDLLAPIRDVLRNRSVPDAPPPSPHGDCELKRAGILVRVDSDKCLVTWIDIPGTSHLSLLVDVVNTALRAAETGRGTPVFDEFYDSSFEEIIAELREFDTQLDAIAAEHLDGHD